MCTYSIRRGNESLFTVLRSYTTQYRLLRPRPWLEPLLNPQPSPTTTPYSGSTKI